MKNRFARRLLVGAAAGFLSSVTAIAGVEEKIELAEIPADVMEVAKASLTDLRLAIDAPAPIDVDNVIDDNLNLAYEELGEVTMVSANTETEEYGSFVLKIQGTAPDGRRVEINLDPNARVLEIEIEFMVEDVPGAVMQSVETRMPGFAPEFIGASHSASMQVVGYEFVGKMGEDTVDIEVSADGRNITVADQ